MWENCFKFNKKDTYVGKVGSKADEKFEQLWAGSGYDQGGRRRRVTGGECTQQVGGAIADIEVYSRSNGSDWTGRQRALGGGAPRLLSGRGSGNAPATRVGAGGGSKDG